MKKTIVLVTSLLLTLSAFGQKNTSEEILSECQVRNGLDDRTKYVGEFTVSDQGEYSMIYRGDEKALVGNKMRSNEGAVAYARYLCMEQALARTAADSRLRR